MTKITYVFPIKYFKTFDIHVVSVSRYVLHIFHLDRPIVLILYTLVEYELKTLPKHLSSPNFWWHLCVFAWLSFGLFSFDLRVLMRHMVSASSSWQFVKMTHFKKCQRGNWKP